MAGLQDSVRIYDLKTGNLVKSLAKPGSSVALSTAGLLATAGKNSVRVWRTSDWSEAYSVPEHRAPVAFSRDAGYLAATSPKGVRVYSGSDGKFVADIPNSMPPFAFSPGGNVIAVDSNNGIVLWDLEAGKTLRVLDNSEGTFNAPQVRDMKILMFSPDGNSIVAARNTLREGSIFVLEVWDSATGKKVTTIPAQRNTTEHSGIISDLAFAPGGQLLASASRDHSIRLWDLSTLQCVERLHGNVSEVWTLAFAPDGQRIISGAKDGTIRLWHTNATAKEMFFEGNWMPVKFSKDGGMLGAITDQSKFVLLNLKTGEPEDSLELGKLPFSQWVGAVSDDFRVMVHPLPTGGLRVWDLQSRRPVDLASPEIHRTWASISPDGSALLAGGERDSMLWWNLQVPSEAPLRMQGKGALFSRHGTNVVTLHDHSMKLWNATTRSLQAEFQVAVDFGFGTPLALSDDGGILAAGSNPITETENAVSLWDTHNGKLLGVCKGHTQGVRWLAFSPGGETLASVGDDSTLRFWNVRTQQELLSMQRLADPIRDIVFSPDGRWLAAKTLRGLRLLTADPISEKRTQRVAWH